MITYSKDDFESSNTHFQKLYADGISWCPSGIDKLIFEGVKPYHVAIPLKDRNDSQRKVVYAIYDNNNPIIDDNEQLIPNYCFFEDDYKECFKLYRSLQNSKPKIYSDNATLSVGFLRINKSSDQPSDVWQYNDSFLFEHHGNCKQWDDNLKSWMF